VSDRNGRRTILARVIILQLLVSAALLCTSWYYTHDHALTKATPFYIIMFFVGTLRSFYSPAQFPLMTQVVPREAYANSSAWNSTFWHIGVVAGSAGGGLLLSLIGKNYSYAVVLVLILASVVQM